MKRYFSILLFVLALSLLSALAACKGVEAPAAESNAETLPALQAPQNIRLAETQDAILWDAVEGAKAYTVIFNGGSEEQVPVNQYYLEPVTAETTVTLQVKANGDGTANNDSAWATQTVTVTPKQHTVEAPTAGLEYKLLPDGTYEVSCPSKYFQERIVIPDTYKGIPITRIAESAFSRYKDFPGTAEPLIYNGSKAPANLVLKSVRLPAGLQEIGAYAFWACEVLELVDLPNSLLRIEDHAFCFCMELTRAELPESLIELGKYSFQNTDVQSIIIPANTELGEGVFVWCEQLVSATILGDRTELPASLFVHCESLSAITIPDGVTAIPYSFLQNCQSLTEFRFPPNVTEIGSYAFKGTGLTSLQLPETVTKIGNFAFSGSCLTNIQISKIPEYMGGWTFLETPWYETQPDGLVVLNGILLGWKGEMPEQYDITAEMLQGVRYVAAYAFSEFAFEECKNLRSVVFPAGVTFLGGCTFSECSGLEYVQLPAGLTSIEHKEYSGLFHLCKKLTQIVIPASVVKFDYPYIQLSSSVILYYCGTDAEKLLNAFENEYNRNFFQDKIYLYSESKPTQPGNYWHYDETGAPVQWEPVEG